MKLIGDDFRAARHGWLYNAQAAQPLLMALGLTLALLALHVFLQLVFAKIAVSFLGGAGDVLYSKAPEDVKLAARAAVISLLPEGLLISGIALFFASIGNRSPRQVLALQFPRLGILGWSAIVAGFVVAVALWNMGVMKALNIDPSQYLPSSGGADDAASSSGMVEKTIAGMANEPLMMWLTVPSVIFGAPLVEELVFRGGMFSALLKSGVGKIPTVLVTSLLWAVLHAFGDPPLFVFLIFGMGVLLGILLLRFGSLWVTIACHCVWNGLVMLTLTNLAT
jgi:membrane protease YdiL (CAAX protease family)